jgi:hypothetical protein
MMTDIELKTFVENEWLYCLTVMALGTIAWAVGFVIGLIWLAV